MPHGAPTPLQRAAPSPLRSPRCVRSPEPGQGTVLVNASQLAGDRQGLCFRASADFSGVNGPRVLDSYQWVVPGVRGQWGELAPARSASGGSVPEILPPPSNVTAPEPKQRTGGGLPSGPEAVQQDRLLRVTRVLWGQAALEPHSRKPTPGGSGPLHHRHRARDQTDLPTQSCGGKSTEARLQIAAHRDGSQGWLGVRPPGQVVCEQGTWAVAPRPDRVAGKGPGPVGKATRHHGRGRGRMDLFP